jgi:hypothetical protein
MLPGEGLRVAHVLVRLRLSWPVALHRAVLAGDLEPPDTLMLHHLGEGDDHSGVMPKTRWATTIDGASIAYQDFGEGPVTLLVIHGWISHLEVYWEQPRFARFMRRLSRNVRVLRFVRRSGAGSPLRRGNCPCGKATWNRDPRGSPHRRVWCH